jgi:hypothetical protein
VRVVQLDLLVEQRVVLMDLILFSRPSLQLAVVVVQFPH